MSEPEPPPVDAPDPAEVLDALEPVEDVEVPAELPVLSLKEQIVYPGGMSPLVVLGDRNSRLIEDVMSQPVRMVACVAQR